MVRGEGLVRAVLDGLGLFLALGFLEGVRVSEFQPPSLTRSSCMVVLCSIGSEESITVSPDGHHKNTARTPKTPKNPILLIQAPKPKP